MDTLRQIQLALQAHGLTYFGVVSLDVRADFDRFQTWLSEGKQADMEFLTRYQEARRDPQKVLEGAQCAIVFGLPYFQGDKLRRDWRDGRPHPRIAQYARFRDYHKSLKSMGQSVINAHLSPHTARVVVDSAPVLERALAANLENGFIGKNTCFIDSKRGSFFLLGEILTQDKFPEATLSQTEKENLSKSQCSKCNKCQTACPTGALKEDYRLDANLCLSYWTIEHRGVVPEKFWPHFATYYFGCDICQLVCPFNKLNEIPKLPSQIEKRSFPSLFETATMDEMGYQKHFGGTPLTRAKRLGLIRNALIAMTVTKDPKLASAMKSARSLSFPIPETLAQIESYLGKRVCKETSSVRESAVLSETRSSV